MSLLTMVQNICDEVGLEYPSAVYGSTAAECRQILRFLYRAYHDLNNRGVWPELLREHSITLVTAQSAYAYPTDLDRIIMETEWNSDDSWPIYPLTPWEYETRQRGIQTTSEARYFIAKGTTSQRFVIYPTPTSSENGKKFYFLYVSNKWIQTSAGVDSATFAADTDISLLPESLVELGAKWRYKAENGMDYGEDKRLYEQMVSTKLGSKSSSRELRLFGGGFDRRFIDTNNLPEGNYG